MNLNATIKQVEIMVHKENQIAKNQNLLEENKKLKEQIKELQFKVNLMDTILDNMYEAVHAVDINGKIIVYSKQNERHTNLSKEEVIGKNERELWELPPNYEINKMQLVHSGKPIKDMELLCQTVDGKNFKILSGMYPYFENGEYKAFFYTGRHVGNLDSFIMQTYQLQKKMVTDDSNNCNDHLRFPFDDIIGESKALQDSIQIAKKVSNYGSNVLLYGETGTGKELFAKGIHNAGLNSKDSFIALNCAAVPETLIESILFGTVKGCFTGAFSMPGLFEQVGNGTIFLDEINSMPYTMQAKLLRVLQEKKVRRIGDTKDITVNCHVISATNADPKQAIKQGTLRQDLYYRLSTVTITIPPLRERKEDIPLISNHFIKILNKKYGKHIEKIDQSVLEMLYNYDWPGNVRELINLLERIILLSDHNERSINYEAFSYLLHPEKNSYNDNSHHYNYLSGNLHTLLDNYEKQLIATEIQQNNKNLSLTARKLGIDRKTLYRKIEKYQI